MKKIIKIVLTGGPCAGKTTMLPIIADEFSNRGFSVIVVPESVTLMKLAGIKFNVSGQKLFQIEKAHFDFQVNNENTFNALANHSDLPTLIIHDRGLMDISAYVSNDMWHSIIDECGFTNIQIIERYDAVIHLVTAANGAEKYYTIENNIARTEPLADARLLDNKLIDVWSKHPHLTVINNTGSFDDKVNAVISKILNLLQTL